MRTSEKMIGVLRLGCVCLTGTVLVGCASTAHVKSNSTAESLQVTANRVEQQNRDLEIAVEALIALVNNPSGDLVRQFDHYDVALERLYDSVEDTENAVQRMEGKSAAYFAAWDERLEAMNFEVVRAQSESRKVAVSNDVNAVSQRYRETREVVLPLLAYLEDLRKALDSDLTPSGLQSVKDIVSNADTTGRKVQTALTQLATDFAAVGERMSSMTTFEAEPTAQGMSVDTEEAEQAHAIKP